MKFFILALGLLVSGLRAETVPSDSVYNLKGKWKSTSGSNDAFRSLSGQPVVLSMVYTRCKASCPLTIAKMKELEKAAGGGRFVFIMASFDPKYDTVESLKKYISDRKLNPDRWQMLSPASDRDVRELAAVTGTVYNKDDQGEYSHSNMVVLMDAKGVIKARLDGLTADTTEFIKNMKAMKNAP